MELTRLEAARLAEWRKTADQKLAELVPGGDATKLLQKDRGPGLTETQNYEAVVVRQTAGSAVMDMDENNILSTPVSEAGWMAKGFAQILRITGTVDKETGLREIHDAHLGEFQRSFKQMFSWMGVGEAQADGAIGTMLRQLGQDGKAAEVSLSFGADKVDTWTNAYSQAAMGDIAAQGNASVHISQFQARFDVRIDRRTGEVSVNASGRYLDLMKGVSVAHSEMGQYAYKTDGMLGGVPSFRTSISAPDLVDGLTLTKGSSDRLLMSMLSAVQVDAATLWDDREGRSVPVAKEQFVRVAGQQRELSFAQTEKGMAITAAIRTMAALASRMESADGGVIGFGLTLTTTAGLVQASGKDGATLVYQRPDSSPVRIEFPRIDSRA